MSFSFIKNGKDFVTKKQETIVSAAVIIMVTTLIIKFLGVFKLTLLAHTFGASRELDIFFAANTIPNILFNICVLGSLNTALIPILSEVLQKNGNEKLWEVFNSFLNIFAVVLIITGIIGIVEARYIAQFAVSFNISGSQTAFTLADRNLMSEMMRVMFISTLILGVSFLMSGALQVYKRFLVTQLASILYTLGFLAGVIVFVPIMGIMGLAWGVVFGALMHLIVQYPVLKHLGLRFNFKIDLKSNYVRRIGKLMLPRVIGVAGEQIAIVVDTILALALQPGALVAFTFAYSLMIFPVSLIGWSFAQAAFATLSEEFSKVNVESLKSTFLNSFQQITFLILPLMMIFIILRLPIVRLVLGIGQSSEFGWDATSVTTYTLLFFSLGILSQALLSLVVRTFYALQDTATPLKVAIISLITNIFLSIYLVQVFGRLGTMSLLNNLLTFNFSGWNNGLSHNAVAGLALSTTISITLNVLLLLWCLHVKLKLLTFRHFVLPTVKKLISASIMGFCMYLIFKVLDVYINTTKSLEELLLFIFTATLGVFIYLAIELALEDDDIKIVGKVWVYLVTYITQLIKGKAKVDVMPLQENININEVNE